MNEEEKISGVAETMLQTLYARAKESQKPDHKIYDEKAMEIVERLEYDFALADRDLAMSNGVVARTIVLDKMVADFIRKFPDTTVINIACGMDTRFYRVDNGILHWYNLDLPVTIGLRRKYLPEAGRVVTIAGSATESKWAELVEQKNEKVLVIVEGLTMYLSEEEVKSMLSVIDRKFKSATLFIEVLNPIFVGKKIEKSIQGSGAGFTWGAGSGKELQRLVPSLRWKEDCSLVEGMKEIAPVYKVIGKIGFIRGLSNKICVLEK